MFTSTLHAVYPKDSKILEGISIEVTVDRTPNDFLFSFKVSAPELNVNPEFSLKESAHGLWDFDVVEVFLTAEHPGAVKHPRYYEFNVSPLNQYFELKIFHARVDTDSTYRSGFKHEAEIKKREPISAWIARMEIPSSAIGISDTTTPIFGNIFACLGKGEARSYWSLFTPVQSEPDFHLPEHFQKLF